MKLKFIIIVFCIGLFLSIGWVRHASSWMIAKQKKYALYYAEADKQNQKEYLILFDNGIKAVEKFTNTGYKKEFTIYVHPDRNSMDKQWQTDWKMPGFKSECWMVASGVSDKLDVLSPLKWQQEACEHIYAQNEKTQRLFTHELFHVYHGQLNESPDFSVTDTIDWFVEGFATYASGQCDTTRIREVKNAIWFNQVPDVLADFWTGKMKYGLSGSLVMYIDHKYGRKKLLGLLLFNKKRDILNSLKVNETELISSWKQFMLKK